MLIGPHAISWDFFTQFEWGGGERLDFFVRLRQRGRQNLFELLRSTISDFACGRSEDRIFALLGLVDDEKLPLKADYSKPLDQVYAEAVKYMAEKHGSLDILVDESSGTRKGQKMSWIPIWDCLLDPTRDCMNSIVGYAACTYAPQLELQMRTESPNELHFINQSPLCACTSRAELKVRSLQFDFITNIVDMKTLPQLGIRWEENSMTNKRLDDYLYNVPVSVQ